MDGEHPESSLQPHGMGVLYTQRPTCCGVGRGHLEAHQPRGLPAHSGSHYIVRVCGGQVGEEEKEAQRMKRAGTGDRGVERNSQPGHQGHGEVLAGTAT